MLTSTVPLPGSGSLAIVEAIKALYGVAKRVDDFVDELIERMKKAKNGTISLTGRVLEGAKFGFGIGYIVPVALIALGQLILGNPLDAVVTVASAAVLTNPLAMTCAAIGAIYYGWAALSDEERNAILNRLSRGLAIGEELIKAVVDYVLRKTRELLSADNIDEVKKMVSEAAATFGRALSDVTGSFVDKVSGAYDFVADKFKREPAPDPKEVPRLTL